MHVSPPASAAVLHYFNCVCSAPGRRRPSLGSLGVTISLGSLLLAVMKKVDMLL
jgi:hypothetical protein